MTRLLISVEGQTEEAFVTRILAPHLEPLGVFPVPVVVETKRLEVGGKYSGGLSSYGKVRRELTTLLADSAAVVSTIYDAYGLPRDFPGSDLMRGRSSSAEVAAVEGTLAKDLRSPRRFIPFLALHELEAWVFSDASIVATTLGDARLERALSLRRLAGGRSRIPRRSTTAQTATLQSASKRSSNGTRSGLPGRGCSRRSA